MKSGYPRSLARSYGFTLLEALVATTLTLMLFGLLFSILIPAMHSSGRESVQVELQQLALIASEKIIADLESSTSSGLCFKPPSSNSEPSAVGIHRLADVTSDGQQVYEDRLTIYYWDRATDRLMRRTWPPLPPDLLKPVPTNKPFRLDPAELWQVADNANGEERVVAAHIKDFRVEPLAAGSSQPVRLTLSLEAPVPGTERKESFELIQNVFLRQSTF